MDGRFKYFNACSFLNFKLNKIHIDGPPTPRIFLLLKTTTSPVY